MDFSQKPLKFLCLSGLILLFIGSSSLSTISVSAGTTRQPQQCVTVAGDSVAHGGAVYEIPNVGYTSVLTVPIAALAQTQFKAHNIDLKAFDRSVGAVGISSPQKRPYLRTWDYAQLIRDRCQYTIIMPFVNDLTTSDPKEIGAPRYVNGLVQMVKQLAQNNPLGFIFIGNFYLGAPSDFAVRGYAGGMKRENVEYYNWVLQDSCKGALARFVQVTCLNLMDVLPENQNWYLEADINQADFSANLVSWVDPSQQPMLKYFWGLHPDGLLKGDYVHLNLAGKSKVTELFVNVASQKQPLATPPPPAIAPAGAFNASVAVASLSMRNGPGTGYEALFSLDYGTKLVLDGRDNSATWAHGTTDGGVTGWVSVPFLRLEKGFDVHSLPVVG